MAIPTATDELCVTEESCAAGYEGGGGEKSRGGLYVKNVHVTIQKLPNGT